MCFWWPDDLHIITLAMGATILLRVGVAVRLSDWWEPHSKAIQSIEGGEKFKLFVYSHSQLILKNLCILDKNRGNNTFCRYRFLATL